MASTDWGARDHERLLDLNRLLKSFVTSSKKKELGMAVPEHIYRTNWISNDL